MKTVDYIITRASYNSTKNEIIEVTIYPVDDSGYISSSETMNRATLVKLLNQNLIIHTGKFNEENTYTKLNKVYHHSSWNKSIISTSSFTNLAYTHSDSLGSLPLATPRRKTFISFYHKDDEIYRTRFENLTQDLLVNKSVKDGDIDSDNSDGYIKSLIQKDYLKDTTVLAVLIGAKTKCRKHVDWEISGAISTKVGGHSGLIGILLPTHPDYGKGEFYYSNIPPRLSDNSRSDYAIVIEWTNDRVLLQQMLESAFEKRRSCADKKDNSRIQMQKDSCS